MKNSIMNIRISNSVARDIAEDIDEVLELWRRCYMDRQPLDGAQWRMGMNLLVQVKVHVDAAIKREEAND